MVVEDTAVRRGFGCSSALATAARLITPSPARANVHLSNFIIPPIILGVRLASCPVYQCIKVVNPVHHAHHDAGCRGSIEEKTSSIDNTFLRLKSQKRAKLPSFETLWA